MEEEEVGWNGTVVSSIDSTEEMEEELGRLKNFRISKHTRHLLKGWMCSHLYCWLWVTHYLLECSNWQPESHSCCS